MKRDDSGPKNEDELLDELDLLKSMQWAAWKARAKLDEGFYSIGQLDEVRERRLFEAWHKDLGGEEA